VAAGGGLYAASVTATDTLVPTGAVRALRTEISSRPLVVDTLIALGLSALSIFTLLGGGTDLGTLDPLSVTLVLLQSVPLALRRVAPAPVFIVTFTALVLQGMLMTNSYAAPLGSLIALFTVAERLDRRTSGVLALLGGLAIVGLNLYLNALPQGLSGLIQTDLAIFATWVLGTWAKERRAYVGTVEERATRLEREREQRDAEAVAEERERIARELHDVVTHHVSVIVIQAGAGLRAIEKRPVEARKALAAIDSTGRLALADMRRMLGILATPTPSGEIVGAGDAMTDPLAPMPGFDRLGELLEQVRATGLPVELAVEGDPRRLDPGIELSAYRIIQEALTNTLKHARGATAQVRVRYGTAELDIDVTDRGGTGDRGIGVPGESGRGLIGMRERVAVFGGRFEAGPMPGGFRVSARLPIAPPAAAAATA
jgi:signal transduction histidine kinase